MTDPAPLVRRTTAHDHRQLAEALGWTLLQVTGITGAGGTATFTDQIAALTGNVHRVQATFPASLSHLKPAPSGEPEPTLQPMTTFADTTKGPVNIVMGVANPAEY